MLSVPYTPTEAVSNLDSRCGVIGVQVNLNSDASLISASVPDPFTASIPSHALRFLPPIGNQEMASPSTQLEFATQ